MFEHTPVLLDEALAALQVREAGRYLDATFGRGGHTAAILQRIGAHGQVVAIDRDPEAIRAGRDKFAADRRLTLVHSPFSELAQVVKEMGMVGEFNGVLLDLGVSSPQLDDAARGFSFAQDGPLDMRMNNASGPTAADWLAKAPEYEIARVIREFGEERFAKRIARGIVDGAIDAEADRLALSDREHAAVLDTEDSREGPRAFVERRAPQWTAR